MAEASNSLCVFYNKYFSTIVVIYLTYTFYHSWPFYFLVPILLGLGIFHLPPSKAKDAGKYKAVVIGGGISGINIGIRLKEIGIDFVILEKGSNLGGTWRDNVYPGAACDTPSHIYSYSFYPNPWWSKKFSPQAEIHDYLVDVASHFRLFPHFRFNKAVTNCDWDETLQIWRVKTKDGDVFEGNFLISCCGELHVPFIPDFKGLKDFQGKIVHSAAWPQDLELKGKRVAVIGTAASGTQLIPSIADDVDELIVFQRSAYWCPPAQKFDYPIYLKYLFALFPPAMSWHRWYYMGYFEHKFLPLFDKSSKEVIKGFMQGLTQYVKMVVQDPDTAEKLVPRYEMGCKRVSPSDDYLQTFNKPHVQLVTNKIHKLTPLGLKTVNQDEYQVDVIIMATGFDLDKSYKPFLTTGRYGKILQSEWDDAPNAFKGTTYPNMPNMFLMLGPNTNLLHNTRMFMIESQANYITASIKALARSGFQSMDLKSTSHQEYQAELFKKMKDKTYASPACDSYYKTKSGIVFSLWPGDIITFWWQTRSCNLKKNYNLK